MSAQRTLADVQAEIRARSPEPRGRPETSYERVAQQKRQSRARVKRRKVGGK